MTEITARGEKKLVLAAGRAHPELAREIAKELGTELLPVDAYDFANGEIYVRAGESVRGTDAFVIQAHPAPLNNWLMEQLIMIDSLKRASAKRITVVSPFYRTRARTRRAAAASRSPPASWPTCTRRPAPTAS
jgi:ribose-phosphate pyrophosphokinase